MRFCLSTQASIFARKSSESSFDSTRKCHNSAWSLTARPYIKGLPITATTLSRLPNGDHSEQIVRPTYEDYYTLQFNELYRVMAEGAPIKTDVMDCKCLGPRVCKVAHWCSQGGSRPYEPDPPSLGKRLRGAIIK